MIRERAVVLGLAAALALGSEARADSPSAAAESAARPASPRPLRASFDRLPSQAEGRFELARHYETGSGVTKDPYLAAHWARLAAEDGSEAAAAWLRAGAEAGNPYAQLEYGLLCKGGVGKKRDLSAAQLWSAKAIPTLETAANKEDARAATALGVAYAEGLGVKADVTKERAWLELAASKYYPPALGAWGLMLLNGKGGAPDPKTALPVLEGAISLGNFASARELGKAYWEGKVLPKDHALAVKWLTLAGRNGDRESQYQAALMLEHGDGAARDDASALELYRLASALELGDAANNLGVMIQRGRGTEPDPAAAIEWFKKASAWGSAFGDYNLGRAYRDGLGVPVDLDQAKLWLAKAAAAGHPAAKKDGAQVDAVRACLKAKASTVLFGQPLRCALRGGFRSAVVRGGAPARREDDRFWYDTYASSAVLEGSEQLSVGYTMAGDFAHAEYVFPSRLDTEQIKRIAEMVWIKYGKPQRSRGTVAVGPASFEWNLADGILLRVSRGWPDTSTSLEYIHPTRLAQLKREQAQEDSRKRVEQSVAQRNAF